MRRPEGQQHPDAANQVAAAIVAAMDEELEPFLTRATEVGEAQILGTASVRPASMEGQPVLLVRSGIGLVNAASAVTALLQRWRPDVVLSVGTAGGIRGKVQVGDVLAGSELVYSTADATGFGYAMGQVPGMPERFQGDSGILEKLGVPTGVFASGDVFVSCDLLDAVVERFPDAVAVDMESTAIAQVCHSYGIPFCSVRGISDLCGPSAEQEHAQRVDNISELAADAALRVLSAG